MSSALKELIAEAQPRLAADKPIAERLHALWAAAKAARGLDSPDALSARFKRLAADAGIISAIGRHGDGEVHHVVDWAIRGLNPFAKGPLQ